MQSFILIFSEIFKNKFKLSWTTFASYREEVHLWTWHKQCDFKLEHQTLRGDRTQRCKYF